MEERSHVSLTIEGDPSQSVDRTKCIICQQSTQEQVIGSEKGRQRVQEAALIIGHEPGPQILATGTIRVGKISL